MAASTLTWEREVLDKVLYTLTKELEVDAAAKTRRGRRMLHNCCFLEKAPDSVLKLQTNCLGISTIDDARREQASLQGIIANHGGGVQE
jgi:hypothetical protein